ncbi:twin-arginine translocation signal domain-containing protein [Enorma massiliensis]|uniref:twin-arginine translocation signal domain-containing protein n=1 Tax=Enorma massiliensis TaxID=1472761 RepID=UPI0034A47ADE
MANITRRSFVVGSGATALVAALAGCSGGETSGGAGSAGSAAASGGHIYVLTASPDHGWTGQVGVFAQEKVD